MVPARCSQSESSLTSNTWLGINQTYPSFIVINVLSHLLLPAGCQLTSLFPKRLPFRILDMFLLLIPWILYCLWEEQALPSSTYDFQVFPKHPNPVDRYVECFYRPIPKWQTLFTLMFQWSVTCYSLLQKSLGKSNCELGRKKETDLVNS